ncbi:hypothetical protein Z517_10069 [Fonsecaea pedrosoi CBS 271.37]|uniref:Uncharacterized protein n=1 Tax=Fonsecaea pedrosoi CBS 271.37 TaxID=1442368 RepID=A0A0D2GAG9_9EURO|nr:uncharacterized protein Z517_10069 [Fonsecaea pedrosoi CBS 271.37]KIW77623.1 hypothetical protein Z517_10069 [Fonsecaea pedrosoi CBS 271.37]
MAHNFCWYRIIESERKLQQLGRVVEALKPTIQSFLKHKRVGFSVPGVVATSTFAYDKIVKEIAKGDKAPYSWRQLADVSVTEPLSLEDPYFAKFVGPTKKNKSIFPKAVYVAQTYKIIKKCRGLFKESFDKAKPG